jgi:hypothetical protein
MGWCRGEAVDVQSNVKRLLATGGRLSKGDPHGKQTPCTDSRAVILMFLFVQLKGGNELLARGN